MTSGCTKTCGGGTMVMCRYCNEPTPYCGGQQCSGPSIKTLTCNTQCCQGKNHVHITTLFTVIVACLQLMADGQTGVRTNVLPLVEEE